MSPLCPRLLARLLLPALLVACAAPARQSPAPAQTASGAAQASRRERTPVATSVTNWFMAPTVTATARAALNRGP